MCRATLWTPRAQRRAEVLRQVEAVETLMDKILGQLDTKCLCRAAGANRAWDQAASADSLWRAICSREGQSLLLALKARRGCTRSLKQLYIQRLLCGDATMPPAVRRAPPTELEDEILEEEELLRDEVRFPVSDFEVRVEVYVVPPEGSRTRSRGPRGRRRGSR